MDKQCKYQQCNWCQMKDECQIYTENKELEYKILQLKSEKEDLEHKNKALAENVISFGKIIKEKEEIWKYLESRFVKVCKECSPEERALCIGFPDRCEGQCTEIIDMLGLLEKAVDGGKVC